jgi:transcription initiation factor TFIIE subunit alpha
MNRTYYYIDYRAAIDAIKWKVYQMNLQVQGNTVPASERKEYFCERCKSEWTQMEVLDGWSSQGFLCHKCSFVLTLNTENNHGGHEQSTKYHAQFRFITDLLPKIDEIIIPENNFDKALANQKKVVRDEMNPANETAPMDSYSAKPTAVKGMSNVGPTSIAVTLTTSEGPTEAEAAAEQARKEKVAAQNAMPVHFTHSTITGEQVRGLNQPSTLPVQSKSLDSKKASIDTADNNGAGIELDEFDYFERLKAEQAREAAREQEEEYETDDEEDDEDMGFEDVVPTAAGSGAGTPASSSAIPNGLTGVLKKGTSGTGSGTSTGVTSPVTGPGTPAEDGRPAKKLRIEEPVPKEEDESEEDMAFEDV